MRRCRCGPTSTPCSKPSLPIETVSCLTGCFIRRTPQTTCGSSSMPCLPRSRQSIDRQSRTDALMPMGITGITASGTSGSEAFFFVLLGKSPLPKPLEHRAALLSVVVIVGIFDLFRQIVGNQRLHSILVAILDRLLVVPAFELQHIQRTVRLRESSSERG